MTQTPKLQIFGVIPFVNLQNNSWTTKDKNGEKWDEKRNNLYSFLLFSCPVPCVLIVQELSGPRSVSDSVVTGDRVAATSTLCSGEYNTVPATTMAC